MLDKFFRIFTPVMFGYLAGNLHVKYLINKPIERRAIFLENRFLRDMEGKENILPDFPTVGSIIKPLANSASLIGDEDFLSLWAGQSAPMSQNIPARDLIKKLVKEVSDIFKNINNN
jgi:hypothetical protein